MSDQNQYTTLDLLRHGQLETPGVFCAPADAPLSDEGMQNLFKVSNEGAWDIIISSPQKRCRDFAEQLIKQVSERQDCELVIDSAFKEMNFGDWVGIKSETLWKENKEKYQELWQNPDDFIAPNGESMSAFSERVLAGLDNILNTYQNQSILLVTHGGVIRTVLSHALDISSLSVLKFNISYAQMSRLHYYSDGHYSLQFMGKDR